MSPALSRNEIAIRQARRFAALGDPTRLQVFQLLSRSPLSVSEIAERLPVSRPAVSQHLKVLGDAGLVTFEADGTRNIYEPDTDGVASMRDFIDSLWDVGLARFKAAAEAAAAASASTTSRASKSSTRARLAPSPSPRRRRKETP